MRPESIRRFDLFYLASLALSVLGFILSYDALVARVEAKSAEAGMALGFGFAVGIFAFVLTINLLLWFLVSRKRVAIAKWVIALLFVIDLFDLPALVSGGMALLAIIPLLALALRAVAIFYLFQPDSKTWLTRDRAEAAESVQSD
jgi:hypothetical protein